MKHVSSAAQELLYRADFPAEILTGIPVIEIKGRSEVVILSHRGILSYGETEIRVASKLGTITISGDSLRVHRMNRERIVLHGSVSLVRIGAEKC